MNTIIQKIQGKYLTKDIGFYCKCMTLSAKNCVKVRKLNDFLELLEVEINKS